jgi:hypothetical protein
MPTTVHRTAEIAVALPQQQAMTLFTPDGERLWADGWDPVYPQPNRREGAGTVFTTEHACVLTTWIMVDHRPDRVRYARVTSGLSAGTVTVDAVRSSETETVLRVTYDLTALAPAGQRWLDAFDAHYATEITRWSTDIAAALRRTG